jgi:nitrate reductase alpha subunit
VLLDLFRAAKERNDGDAVLAWGEIVGTPELAKQYKSARGKGGFVRATWDEAVELASAAHVHTVKTWGPDRVAGFSPIPAMSMVSHAAGARFYSLLGAPLLSFYDWYADLPMASPQVFGDQTDVPESGDWWGRVLPDPVGFQRPGHPHTGRALDDRGALPRSEGRRLLPDYSDATKFADEWLAPAPGTDGALAMAMGHVVLREFFVDRTTPVFDDYVKRFTDLPFLVTLQERDGRLVPGRFLTAHDLGETDEHSEFKTVLLDSTSGEPHVPGGSLGFRFGQQGAGRWNLELGDVDPQLTTHGAGGEPVEVTLPRFDTPDGSRSDRAARGADPHRRRPPRDDGLRPAARVYGVGRDGLPGSGRPATTTRARPAPRRGRRRSPACPPTRRAHRARVRAERARLRRPVDDHHGRRDEPLLPLDTIYRAFLMLTTITGCQGKNGGGWAHYVGQEKVRPVTGHSHLAMSATGRARPRR